MPRKTGYYWVRFKLRGVGDVPGPWMIALYEVIDEQDPWVWHVNDIPGREEDIAVVGPAILPPGEPAGKLCHECSDPIEVGRLIRHNGYDYCLTCRENEIS